MNLLMRLRRTLDRLTIYLPLFLFAILALGSWWLVRSVPELMPPGIDPQLRQDPDFRLDQFTVKSFDATGRLTREVSGQSATHFPPWPSPAATHADRGRLFQWRRGISPHQSADNSTCSERCPATSRPEMRRISWPIRSFPSPRPIASRR